jgi:arginase
MTSVALIAVPYDSGHLNKRMGAGPRAIIDAGIEKSLRDAGHTVNTTSIELPANIFSADPVAAFTIHRLVALAVRAAIAAGQFPIVLSGNCNTAVGTLAGVGNPDIGIMWFDAHGDLNTPETSPSGFFDGMALAIAVGRCWKEAVKGLPWFTPVSESRVVHLGARELDPGESRLIDESEIEVVSANGVRDGLAPILSARRESTRDVYLHLDLDVLDTKEGKANGYATAGGLSGEELATAVSEINSAFVVRAAALTAYDPSFDTGKHNAKEANRIATQLASAAGA